MRKLVFVELNSIEINGVKLIANHAPNPQTIELLARKRFIWRDNKHKLYFKQLIQSVDKCLELLAEILSNSEMENPRI